MFYIKQVPRKGMAELKLTMVEWGRGKEYSEKKLNP